MSWKESSACTPLKRDFLRVWFAGEKRFFLTGGTALGLFYLDHRRSYDLDLFSTEEVSGLEVRNAVARVAGSIGAEWKGLQSSPDFHRFRLTRGDERELVDVVIDRVPQLDVEKVSIDGIRVDTLREILANKMAALVSRAESKDVVDLYFLQQAGHDLKKAVSDARKKDGGWDPAVVVMLLDSPDFVAAPEWMIREVSADELRRFVRKLRLEMAQLALPPEASDGIEP